LKNQSKRTAIRIYGESAVYIAKCNMMRTSSPQHIELTGLLLRPRQVLLRHQYFATTSRDHRLFTATSDNGPGELETMFLPSRPFACAAMTRSIIIAVNTIIMENNCTVTTLSTHEQAEQAM